MSDVAPVRPSWDSLPQRVRRTIDLKLIIAVLIGLVSVTGAIVAWRSSQSGEFATDKDRQAIAESTTLARSAADNEIILQDARGRFADHAAAIVNAGLLDQQADRLEGSGNPDAARAARDEADEQRAVARRVLEGGSAPVLLADYVTDAADGAGGAPTFDEDRLRDDLEQASASDDQVDPSQTVSEGNRLRAESQFLDGILVFVVVAVVFLTLAQISRRRLLRLAFMGVGVAVWISSSVIAITGGP